MTKLLACLPLAALAFGAPARAQTALAPPSPAGAAALQGQIQSALEAVIAKPAKPPARLVQVSPQGDHYALSVLLAPLIQGFAPPAAAFTATLRPVGTGWAIDNQQFPAEFDITGADKPSPATYQVKLGTQDEHGTFDPNGTVVASSGGTIASADIVKTGGAGASLSHFGPISNQSSARPSGAGRVDELDDVSVDGYAGQFADPDAVRSEVTAQRLHVAATFTGVSLAASQRVWTDFLHHPALSPAQPGLPPTPEQKARLRQMLVAAEGLLTGAQVDEEADGVKFELAGHSGALDKLELTLGGQAPQDMLSASLGVVVEGMRLDELPPAFAAYVPTRIAFRPTAANISVADVTKLALDSLAPNQPTDPATHRPVPPLADYQALFSHGGLQVGFDQLAIDMAGAQLSGTGSFTMTGPQTLSGAAQITAHGLDELITRLQADPVAAQAAPVVILLKGIAKTTPDGAVWQITVQDRKVLVNGLDVGAMAAAMGK